MERIEQEVGFVWDKRAGNRKHYRTSAGSPRIANRLHRAWDGVRFPILWQRRPVQWSYENRFDLDFEEDVFLQELRRIQMYKHL